VLNNTKKFGYLAAESNVPNVHCKGQHAQRGKKSGMAGCNNDVHSFKN